MYAINVKEFDKPFVFVDTREPDIIDTYFRENGVEVIRRQLDIGDYVVSLDTVIERKRREDFESSIIDGRLFSQAERLREIQNKIFIIEGNISNSRINRKALLGAYSSLIIDYNISLMFTRNIRATAELISAMVKHEQLLRHKENKLFFGKKPKEIHQIQRKMLEVIPNVGPSLADKLLSQFNTIRDLSNSQKRTLLSVDGIGDKKADLIWKVFNMPYGNYYNKKKD